MNLNIGGVTGVLTVLLLTVFSTMASAGSSRSEETPGLFLVFAIAGGAAGNFLWNFVRGEKIEITARNSQFACPICAATVENKPSNCPSCGCDLDDVILQKITEFTERSWLTGVAAIVCLAAFPFGVVGVFVAAGLHWFGIIPVFLSVSLSVSALLFSQKALRLARFHETSGHSQSSAASARKLGVYVLGFNAFIILWLLMWCLAAI